MDWAQIAPGFERIYLFCKSQAGAISLTGVYRAHWQESRSQIAEPLSNTVTPERSPLFWTKEGGEGYQPEEPQ